MSAESLVDPGAPVERTQMAWTRTGLAVLATSAVGARLLLPGPLWLVGAVAGFGAASGCALLLLGVRRYGLVRRRLRGSAPAAVGLPPAVGLATAAAVVLLSALLAVGALVTSR